MIDKDDVYRETKGLKCRGFVLLRDNQVMRNHWPVRIVTKTFPSDDGKVRKIEVKMVRDSTARLFLRPVSEAVLRETKRHS